MPFSPLNALGAFESAVPVAFLGLGVMGGPMATNLARSGATVRGWNRTGDRASAVAAFGAGVVACPSIAAAVADAAVIFTCLGDVPDVEAVLLGPGGVADSARSGAIVVDTSTIGPMAARDLGRRLGDRGLRFLDAPISGGDIGARNGTLTVMVGGDPADFETCRGWFSAIGKTIRHCGPIGSGQAVKLCNQVLAAGHMMALCEAIALAEAVELDPNLVIDVCSTGAAGSWALANLGPKIVAEDYAPGFAIAHMLKDLRLVQETLAAQGIELPTTALADQCFQGVATLDENQGRWQGTQAAMRAYRRGVDPRGHGNEIAP
ncbi:MAG: NAD(P)-dependent oxidoreductase [Cyanophyceae cyanobacterium]